MTCSAPASSYIVSSITIPTLLSTLRLPQLNSCLFLTPAVFSLALEPLYLLFPLPILSSSPLQLKLHFLGLFLTP